MPAASVFRLLALAAIWGASFLFMRIAAPVLGGTATAWWRVLLGALGLVVLMLAMRAPMRLGGKARATALIGVINSALPFWLYAMAARWLPAGYSAILNAMTPLMGVAVGALWFGEAATARKLSGVVIGLAGVAVLSGAGPAVLTHDVLLGIAACLLATACYAVAGFLTRRWVTNQGGLDSRAVALGSQLGALAVLTPVAAVDAWLHPVAWAQVSLGVAGSLLALGLVCTALAYILYFQLIADVGPLRALAVTFLIPVFGVLWAWLFLGEQVSAGQLVGAALIAVALTRVWR